MPDSIVELEQDQLDQILRNTSGYNGLPIVVTVDRAGTAIPIKFYQSPGASPGNPRFTMVTIPGATIQFEFRSWLVKDYFDEADLGVLFPQYFDSSQEGDIYQKLSYPHAQYIDVEEGSAESWTFQLATIASRALVEMYQFVSWPPRKPSVGVSPTSQYKEIWNIWVIYQHVITNTAQTYSGRSGITAWTQAMLDAYGYPLID